MMSRVLPLPVLFGLACADPETVPTETTPSTTDTETTPGPTDTDTETTDLFTPPAGITDPCWSWQVEYEGESTVRERTLRYHDPESLEVTHIEKDQNADGFFDYVGEFLYEPLFGYLVARQLDINGDGVTDEITRWVYDAAGLLVELNVDRDGDGARDTMWTYTYDGTLRTLASEDDRADGTIDTVVAYTYDDAGRTLRIDDDRGNDGAIDNITTFTYEDEVGPNVTVVHDDGNDGLVDLEEIFVYDAFGRVSHYEQFLDNGFSTFDDYSYLESGDVATYEREIYLDDEWAQYEHWGYDYFGPRKPQSVVIEYFTVLGAAVPALTVRSDYTWSCPLVSR